MKMSAGRPFPYLKLGLAAAIAAGASGAAFAAWVENGAQILLTMAESGLSWCF